MQKIIFKTLFTSILLLTLFACQSPLQNKMATQQVIKKETTRIISGTVYSQQNKKPVQEAEIFVQGVKQKRSTDFDGFYELEIPSGKKITLVVKAKGFKIQEVKVAASQKIADIYLQVQKEKVGEKQKDEIVATKKAKLRGKTKAKVTTTSPPPPPPPSPEDEIFKASKKEITPTIYRTVDVTTTEYEEVSEVEATSPSSAEPTPSAGLLTAGILNDFGKWNLWQDIQENELKEWQKIWKISPWDRYPVQLTTQNGYPVINAKVSLKDGDKVLWTARTDNTDKAELWANLYQQGDTKDYTISIQYTGETYMINQVKDFHEGGNTKVLPVDCNINRKMDIAFVVDATGSMRDEINYMKKELTDVIQRSKKALQKVDLRVGSVFYRDIGDEYVTRKSHFSSDISKTVNFIEAQRAAGGGDGPEAIEEALEETLGELRWRDDAATRLMFLILDAPPHQVEDIQNRIKTQVEKAAEMGVRIIPVTCSGTERSTEYLMRSIALATNGSYIYLTDDSGIGGSHTKPITDEHKTVMLNDLLVETITNFATMVECNQLIDTKQEELQDTMQIIHTTQIDNQSEEVFSWKYYPNPTYGQLTIEIKGELDYLYFVDNSGKILRRIQVTEDTIELDVSSFPAGMYYLKGIGKNDEEALGKVVLVRA